MVNSKFLAAAKNLNFKGKWNQKIALSSPARLLKPLVELHLLVSNLLCFSISKFFCIIPFSGSSSFPNSPQAFFITINELGIRVVLVFHQRYHNVSQKESTSACEIRSFPRKEECLCKLLAIAF
jgi:hypothetical protein